MHEELGIVKEDVRKLRESRRRNKKKKIEGVLGEVGFDEGMRILKKGKRISRVS